ncbi:hypothetical protein H5410_056678 [Solanum commersonii]|uniref:Uncharacterized protein n=1 Tax=Solanum commersonii TaxID=4109 RepID=A0A9J5WND9_SOLCO|nr:hypothetical protein H5410_056678 [Solanum commersonii]
MDLLLIWISDVIFAKKFHGHLSRPQLWMRLVLIGKPSHFQGQTIHDAGKPPILPIFMSVKTITMEPIGPEGKTIPFPRSTEPRSG